MKDFQALGINYFNNTIFLLRKASQFSNFKYRFQTQNLFAGNERLKDLVEIKGDLNTSEINFQ